jgi:hypothetical protein
MRVCEFWPILWSEIRTLDVKEDGPFFDRLAALDQLCNCWICHIVLDETSPAYALDDLRDLVNNSVGMASEAALEMRLALALSFFIFC